MKEHPWPILAISDSFYPVIALEEKMNKVQKTIFLSIFGSVLIIAGVVQASLTERSFAMGTRDSTRRDSLATVGTNFTYQGRLSDNGSPANGAYDFVFRLYDASSGGTEVGGTNTLADVVVIDGYFTVTLDFGAVLDGKAVWLEIGVRPGGSPGAYTTLDPRQSLTAAPYALSLRPGARIVGTSGNAALTLSNPIFGLEVSQAANAVYIGQSTDTAIWVNDSDRDGLYINNAADEGVQVNTAGLDGYYIGTAGDHGFHVNASGGSGLVSGHSDSDGVYICSTGSRTGCTPTSSNNGIEIGRPEDHGVFIDDAGGDGIFIDNSAFNGVYMNSPGSDGLFIFLAGEDGIDVSGNSWAGNFFGDIQVSGSCTGCTLATFGINAGDESLAPGDVVAILGMAGSRHDGVAAFMKVGAAREGDAVVGVVLGRAEEVTQEKVRERETGLRLVPRAGAAGPGEYVHIVIYGLVQARTSLDSEPIHEGTRLTVDAEGQVRALRSVTVEGIELTEGVPTLGLALEVPGGDGLVWVLVNPQ